MLKGFWIDNKQFLLVVGGCLFVFLIADGCIGSWLGKTEKLRDKRDQLRLDVVVLHDDLARDSHHMEKAKSEAYQEHEKELAGALCLPETEQVEGESSQLPIRFDQAISNTWAGLRQEANQAGLLLPRPLTKDDFGVHQDDKLARYQEHYSYLAIVNRAMGILIKAGVKEIRSPEILPPVLLGVKDNDTKECLYRGISIPVTLSFASLQKVFDGVQDTSGPFLQVRLRGLDAKGAPNEEERSLQGDIEFVGFRLDERRVSMGSEGGRARRSGSRRRRR